MIRIYFLASNFSASHLTWSCHTQLNLTRIFLSSFPNKNLILICHLTVVLHVHLITCLVIDTLKKITLKYKVWSFILYLESPKHFSYERRHNIHVNVEELVGRTHNFILLRKPWVTPTCSKVTSVLILFLTDTVYNHSDGINFVVTFKIFEGKEENMTINVHLNCSF